MNTEFNFDFYHKNKYALRKIVQNNFNHIDQIYFDIISKIIEEGVIKEHKRSGHKKLSLFNVNFTIQDITNNFPSISLKKTNYRAAIDEQQWFLTGSNNINDLPERSRFVWKDWADKNGSIKQAYGKQLINDRVNQIEYLLNNMINSPEASSHLLSYWNPETAVSGDWALPPCHYTSVYYLFKQQSSRHSNKMSYKLNTHVTMRSSDVFIGLPFNLVQYSYLMQLLTTYLTLRCNKDLYLINDLAFTLVDAHIYDNQVDAINKMFANILNIGSKKPYNNTIRLMIRDHFDFVQDICTDDSIQSISEWNSDHFEVYGYAPLPFVKCPVVV